MKLLVVEDETKTADYLRQGLVEAGFVVDLARTGLDGHHLAMSELYDLIILDVMLPDVDGWRSCSRCATLKKKRPGDVFNSSRQRCRSRQGSGTRCR